MRFKLLIILIMDNCLSSFVAATKLPLHSSSSSSSSSLTPSNSNRKTTNEYRKNLEKKVKTVRFYHGTDGSIVLPSSELFGNKIMAYGRLKEKGFVPFSGERGQGIQAGGVSLTSISAYDAKHPRSFAGARSYSKYGSELHENDGGYVDSLFNAIGLKGQNKGKGVDWKMKRQDEKLENSFRNALDEASVAAGGKYDLALYWVSKLHDAASQLRSWNPNLYKKLLMSDPKVAEKVAQVKSILHIEGRSESPYFHQNIFQKRFQDFMKDPNIQKYFSAAKSVRGARYSFAKSQGKTPQYLKDEDYIPLFVQRFIYKYLRSFKGPAPTKAQNSESGFTGPIAENLRQKQINEIAISTVNAIDSHIFEQVFKAIKSGKVSSFSESEISSASQKAWENYKENNLRHKVDTLRSILDPDSNKLTQLSEQQKRFMLSESLPIVLEGKIAITDVKGNKLVERSQGRRHELQIKRDLEIGKDIDRIHVTTMAHQEKVRDWLKSRKLQDKVQVVLDAS